MKIIDIVVLLCVALCMHFAHCPTPWLNDNDSNSSATEGDIAFEDAPDTEQSTDVPDNRQHGVGSDTSIQIWEERTIPFGMDSYFNLTQRSTILLAMAEIEDKTCLKFVARTKEVDYISFKYHPQYCSSRIGRVGQRQHINLTEKCVERDSVQHELMHALGFHHEHSRHDRDRYIAVNLSRVDSKYHLRFEKRQEDPLDSKYPYDYKSIMHYPVNAHAVYMNSITIQSKFDSALIKSDGLSHTDVSKINFVYKCKKLEENSENEEDSSQTEETATRNVTFVVTQPLLTFTMLSSILTVGTTQTTSTTTSTTSRKSKSALNHELIVAVKNGNLETVKQLVNAGAHVDARAVDPYNETVLHIASIKGNVNIVSFLLSHSANVHAKDSVGDTPLHNAVNTKHADVVQVLLNYGANINEKNLIGETPLHDVSVYGPKSIVLILLENGANIFAKDNSGTTPLDYARYGNNTEIVEIIESKQREVSSS